MSSKINRSPSLPLSPRAKIPEQEAVLSPREFEIKRLEALIEALRLEKLSSRPPQVVNEQRYSFKQELMFSQSNALLKAFPHLQKTFNPQNIITLRVPQKSGKEETFLLPAAAMLLVKNLVLRFEHSFTDTSQKEIILLKPDGTCYQLAAINYLLGRGLQLDECTPLKNRPKKEVDAIFQEIWEFADGYHPPLLEDCRDYLKERVFKEFNDCLSYGTTVFEMNDPATLKNWQNQLEDYFKTDPNKEGPILRFLTNDFLRAYANDFDAFKKARQYVFAFLKTVPLITTSSSDQLLQLDRLYTLIKAVLKTGDIEFAKALFRCGLENKYAEYINYAEYLSNFPDSEIGDFCRAFLLLFQRDGGVRDFKTAEEILGKLDSQHLQDEKLKGLVRKLLVCSRFIDEEVIMNLLASDPNDLWAQSLFIDYQLDFTDLNEPENLERAKELIDRALVQFPTNQDFNISKLKLYAKIQQEENALATLYEALAFDPRKEGALSGYADLTCHYAKYYLQKGKIDEACKLLQGIPQQLLSDEEADLLLEILDFQAQTHKPLAPAQFHLHVF